MASRITPEIVADIKSQIDLSEIIQRFVPLKRQGNRWTGVCPFHDDTSPSMYVTPTLGIYKCFACGAAGDVFKFLQEHEKMDFITSVEYVAHEINYTLPEEELSPNERARREEKKSLADANELAAKWYENCLPENNQVKDYLFKRDIPLEIARQFRLGWSPDKWDSLLGEAQKNGISRDELEKSGLVIEKEDGRCYDRFRGRLMFPIQNLSGKVIAFGGRTLDPQGMPKYLNSPETAVYVKSEVLYGFNFARADISRKEEVIVVEGYFDVIRLHQHGIKNTVAVSGTALTVQHAKLLKRFAKKCFLVFDGDEAGRKAARRSLENLLPTGMAIRILLLPEGEDPDSLVKEKGAKALEARLLQSMDLSTFLYNWADFANASPEEKATKAHEVTNLLALIKDPIIKAQHLQLFSEKSAINLQHLVHNQVNLQPPTSNSFQHSFASPPMLSAISGYEARFVSLIFDCPTVLPLALRMVDCTKFQDHRLGELLDHALSLAEDHGSIEKIRLYDILDADSREVLALLPEEEWNEESALKAFAEHLIKFDEIHLKKMSRPKFGQNSADIESLRRYQENQKRIVAYTQLRQKVAGEYIDPVKALEQFALLRQKTKG